METNLFDYKRVAEGYAKDRPFLHGKVIEKFSDALGGRRRFKEGLDIGCGAGLSTKALGMICDKVLGIDTSQEMIFEAENLNQEKRFRFEVCRAEDLKTGSRKFDIVTAAGVINWVDEEVFLPIVSRLLTDHGYFLIYDFGISDRMDDNAQYDSWWHDRYLPEFPKPARKETKWSEAVVAPFHLHMERQEDYTLEYKMSREQFIRFMMLQSNVTVQIEEKGRSRNEVCQWFEKTTDSFWQKGEHKLYFTGYSWYITKFAE